MVEGVNRSSPPEAKIALFMHRFRGRDDVYARRFESARSGKSGYTPACANEWVRGLCDKPRVTCAACPNRKFLPITPEVIAQHLTGKDASGRPFVLGIYPLLPDESCFWVAADFDDEEWQDDVAASCVFFSRRHGGTEGGGTGMRGGSELRFFLTEARGSMDANVAWKRMAILV